jgi:hypothetical protein
MRKWRVEIGKWKVERFGSRKLVDGRKEKRMMFEDLEAWQQARHLVNEIYSLTRENSSLSKDFGLTGQVQRAAVSIMSNIWACEVL